MSEETCPLCKAPAAIRDGILIAECGTWSRGDTAIQSHNCRDLVAYSRKCAARASQMKRVAEKRLGRVLTVMESDNAQDAAKAILAGLRSGRRSDSD